MPAAAVSSSAAWADRFSWADPAQAFPEGLPPAALGVFIFYALLFFAGLLADALLIARAPRFSAALQETQTRWLAARPVSDRWLMMLFLLAMLLHIAAAWVGGLILPTWVAGALLVQSLMFHGVILVLSLIGLARAGTAPAVFLGWSPGDGGRGRRVVQGLWGYLAVLPPMMGAAALSFAILTLLGLPAEPQPITDLFNRIQGPANQILLVLVAAGLAPLGEEALFRGLLLPALTRRLGLIAGVAISAALFALLHFNAFAFLPLFTFGLALGAAYWMTGSLLVPILMHAAFNAVNSTLLMVLPAGF